MATVPAFRQPVSGSDLGAVAEAKVHLAAALRLAVLHELEEGIDNHFTVTVPGRDGEYLILPFGRRWPSTCFATTGWLRLRKPRPSIAG